MTFGPLRELAPQVRAIPLEAVLRLSGAKPDRCDQRKWHTSLGVLSVTGAKFMNWTCGHGGGGAIDLVMHLHRLRFQELVESAIDAISCFALHPRHRCIATAGARPNPRWLAALLGQGEWKQHLIEAASERVKKQVRAKQFQIFYLHVLKEIAVDEVCQRLKVSRAQVYLAKLRVGRLFRQHIETLEKTLA